MDYKIRLKEILWENNISGRKLIEENPIMSYDHYKKSTAPKGLDCCIWVKAFVLAYEMGLKQGANNNKNE